MAFEYVTKEPEHAARRTRWIASLVLVVLGCALFLPFVDRAWTSHEANPGTYYGSFNTNYERFGFFHLWGLEVSPAVKDLQKGAIGYLNHPPAMAWVMYWCGLDEWQMRMPTVICVMILAVLLFRMLTASLGTLPAFGAGLLMIYMPTMSVYGQNSYELAVAVFGFAMMIAHDRTLRAEGPRRRDLATVIACAFLGPWFDWSFWIYCAALVPITWGRGGLVRKLWIPAASAVASVALLLLWRVWVQTLEHLPKPPAEQAGLLEIIRKVMHESSGRTFGDWVDGFSRMFQDGFTLPLCALALVGSVPLFRRAPRLAIAFAIGIAHPVMFPSHSFDHAMFFVYFAPFMAAASAAAIGLGRRLGRPVQVALIALSAAAPAYSAYYYFASTESDFYKDLGRILTDAVEYDDRAPDGTHGYNVGHSWPYGAYLAYLDSWRVFATPVRDAAALAAAPESGAPRGARYVWLKFSEVPEFATRKFADPPGLSELMERFPKTRLPELEVRIDVSGKGHHVTISEAWLVTLAEPGKG